MKERGVKKKRIGCRRIKSKRRGGGRAGGWAGGGGAGDRELKEKKTTIWREAERKKEESEGEK